LKKLSLVVTHRAGFGFIQVAVPNKIFVFTAALLIAKLLSKEHSHSGFILWVEGFVEVL
jgi:hypothetical protein